MRRGILFALVVALTFTFTTQVQADKLSDVKNQSKSVSGQLNSVKYRKQQLKKAVAEKKAKQEALLQERKKRQVEYEKLSKEIESLDKTVKLMELQLAEAEDRYAGQQDMLKTRLKVMYENSDVSYLQSLLESRNITEFFQKLSLISVITKNDKQLMDDLDQAKKDVEYKRDMQEKLKLNAEAEARNKQQAINQADTSRAMLDDQIRNEAESLKELERQEDQLLEESKKLNKLINQLQKGGKKVYEGGTMKWPIPGHTKISSYFGNRYHPVLKKYKGHTGVDIPAPSGTSILAAAKGTVIIAGWQTGFGNTVIIDHGGGIATLYGHASKVLVRKGQSVNTGDLIAKVGSTGWSTGPHLHFEIRKNGNPIDPFSQFKK